MLPYRLVQPVNQPVEVLVRMPEHPRKKQFPHNDAAVRPVVYTIPRLDLRTIARRGRVQSDEIGLVAMLAIGIETDHLTLVERAMDQMKRIGTRCKGGSGLFATVAHPLAFDGEITVSCDDKEYCFSCCRVISYENDEIVIITKDNKESKIIDDKMEMH